LGAPVSLRLLPGEREEIRLHPSHSTAVPRQAMALGFALAGGLLWAMFHAPWWQAPAEPRWYLPWRYLVGNGPAAVGWALALLAAGGAATCLPRGPWRRLWVALGAGILACAVAAYVAPHNTAEGVPIAVALLALPGLAWAELVRTSTHYHVTNLRLAVRTTLPRRGERSVLYSDLVDLDARASDWPDTGTLLPVTAKPEDGGEAQPALRIPGVRPFKRVRRAVELLAQRASASEPLKATKTDADLAEALAALHRR